MAGFEELFNNPAFVYGMGMLGGSRSHDPYGSAQDALLKMQQTQLTRQKLAQEKALQDAQITDLGAQAQQRTVQGAQMQTMMDRQGNFMKMLEPYLQQMMGQQGGMPPTGMPQALPQSAPGAVGKYGTPAPILDNLLRIESSNGKNVIGPYIPGKGNAMGPYQHLKGTVDMLSKEIGPYNVFDAQQSRDATDFYLQKLLKQNGGDWPKTLAQYGGFAAKDPSNYVAQGMQGVATPPAAGGMAPTPSTTGIDPIKMASVGMMADLAGMKGEGFFKMADLAKPQVIPANAYIRDAAGNMVRTPDPHGDAALAIQRQAADTAAGHLTQDVARTMADTTAKAQVQRTQFANDTAEYRGLTSGLDRLTKNAGELLDHPGLPANTGWSGALGVPKIPGSTAHDAQVKLESLKSKLLVEILSDLKKSSGNGSSGFGSLSNPEGETLRTYIQNLDNAQSLPAMKKALGDLREYAAGAKQRYAEKYANLYPQQAPEQPAPPSQSGMPSDIDALLKKHGGKK